MKKIKETTKNKEIKSLRKELDKVIEKHDFDMSDKEVVKKSLETEKAMNDILKVAKD